MQCSAVTKHVTHKKKSCLHLPTGVLGDQEDEEAFLDGITNAAGTQLPQLAVKVRLQSTPAWSPAVLLKPGQHQAGLLSSFLVFVSYVCTSSTLQQCLPFSFLQVPVVQLVPVSVYSRSHALM